MVDSASASRLFEFPQALIALVWLYLNVCAVPEPLLWATSNICCAILAVSPDIARHIGPLQNTPVTGPTMGQPHLVLEHTRLLLHSRYSESVLLLCYVIKTRIYGGFCGPAPARGCGC